MIEAGGLLLIVSAGLRLFSVPTLRRLLGHTPRSRDAFSGAISARIARRIGWSVGAVARRLPWPSTCLIEALAADAMLHRRGCRCELLFGVRPPPTHGDLHAHAWLECDGCIVIGDLGSLSDYAILSARSPVP